jgi:hypothetical protein
LTNDQLPSLAFVPMPEYGDLLRNYSTAAAQDLKPMIREAATALGLEGDRLIQALGGFMARAWMAGALAGQSEMVAQAIDQGAQVDQTMLRPPDEPDAP